MDEEAVQECIKKDSKLECYEVLSNDDIVLRVTCGSETEECSATNEDNLIPQQKLSQDDALVHAEALLNYLEQENDMPAEKMMIAQFVEE